MTNERLQKLKELYSKATPGEWETNSPNPTESGWRIFGYDTVTLFNIKRKSDAAFITAAHNAIPELLAMAEEALRLREVVDAYRTIKSLDKERARISLEWSTAFNHGDSNHDAIFKRLEAKENELNQARQRLTALEAGESEGV